MKNYHFIFSCVTSVMLSLIVLYFIEFPSMLKSFYYYISFEVPFFSIKIDFILLRLVLVLIFINLIYRLKSWVTKSKRLKNEYQNICLGSFLIIKVISQDIILKYSLISSYFFFSALNLSIIFSMDFNIIIFNTFSLIFFILIFFFKYLNKKFWDFEKIHLQIVNKKRIPNRYSQLKLRNILYMTLFEFLATKIGNRISNLIIHKPDTNIFRYSDLAKKLIQPTPSQMELSTNLSKANVLGVCIGTGFTGAGLYYAKQSCDNSILNAELAFISEFGNMSYEQQKALMPKLHTVIKTQATLDFIGDIHARTKPK